MPRHAGASASAPANGSYVIREGDVVLKAFAPSRRVLLIHTVAPGDVLGWARLFPSYRWPSDARGLELERAIALDRGCLRIKCEEDSRLGHQLIRRLAPTVVQRFQATRLRLLDVYGRASPKEG